MAQVKLNLQPPPNVEFVTGYPGIPPGSDRPQAAVKGAIEVRIPSQGIKAKWVRIELRKVEILPGGGSTNTYYDFVGPSPVNLWSSPDEYSLLRSQDFPFSIRIPESIPPTVSLDSRAGIGYELVASVCTKGKRGFLRKAKSVVVSTISPITIDKHELHSTWPVYCQPETRHVVQDGVNLSVQRNNTCYGPGDRISVTVVVKSDSVQAIMLRILELSLKETTVFRASAIGPARKVPPQERQLNIAESKVPVNMTLYGGSSHSAELSCLLSPTHTTTTLNAARHIDITYTLCIKALLSAGAPLVMELPVIISNWQRNVSHEAINRIGPTHGLSLLPAGQSIPPNRGRPTDAVAVTLPYNRPNYPAASGSAYNSLPTHAIPPDDGASYGASRFGNGLADEFGSVQPIASNAPKAVVPPSIPPSIPPTTSSPPALRRPDSSGGGGNRFTVTNLQPHDNPQPTPIPSRQLSTNATGSGPSSGVAQQKWPRAEDEKKKLFDDARAKVMQVQGPGSTPSPATVTGGPSTPPQAFAGVPPRAAAAAGNKTTWMSAAEEKFQQAQAAVQKTQGLPYMAPPPLTHARNESDSSNRGQPSSSGKPTAAAALYAQAISAQGRSAVGPGPSASSPTKPKPTVPQYLTAEQEKAALRRYEEAKRAVDRTQNSEFSSDMAPSSSAPIAYESLFPAAASSSSRPTATDQPPPFNTSVIPQSHLSEKERLRRAYEANDAAARARQNASPPPPLLSPPTHNQYTSALEEKEALRKKFEERDNAQARGALVTPQTPPRNGGFGPGFNSGADRSPTSGVSPRGSNRPTPLPPSAGTSQRVLTAAEEKALLRAKLEARDAAEANRNKPTINGNNNNHSSAAPITPPPLMPRPPVEYIKETQEEDARVSRLNDGEIGPVLYDGSTPSSSQRGTPKPQDPKGINGRSQADI